MVRTGKRGAMALTSRCSAFGTADCNSAIRVPDASFVADIRSVPDNCGVADNCCIAEIACVAEIDCVEDGSRIVGGFCRADGSSVADISCAEGCSCCSAENRLFCCNEAIRLGSLPAESSQVH